MFNDSDNGQTQYCPMCEENSRKQEELKKNLLFINREIVSIANDGLTHHLTKTAVLGLNHSLADIIREM